MIPEDIYPKNIGDIYRVYDYCGAPYDYGVAYRNTCPLEPHRWCWWISMSDGDLFHWHRGYSVLEFLRELSGASALELIHRNPLPNACDEDEYHAVESMFHKATLPIDNPPSLRDTEKTEERHDLPF